MQMNEDALRTSFIHCHYNGNTNKKPRDQGEWVQEVACGFAPALPSPAKLSQSLLQGLNQFLLTPTSTPTRFRPPSAVR